MEFLDSPNMQYWLPLLIFFSRILDVSLGTLRIIFVNRGMRYLAPVIGFFEVLIWLVVITQIMQRLSSPINYIAYAGGFATGNFVGIWLEGKLAVGITMVRVITRTKALELVDYLRDNGFRVTHVPAISNSGKVEVLFLPARRREVPALIDIVKEYNPNALYTIEDMRMVSMGSLPGTPLNTGRKRKTHWRMNRFKRKGK